MYETYWRLGRSPFENDGNAEFYFPSETHEGALLKLRYLVEHRKGAAVLAAGHGLGKTYLTHVLACELDPAKYPISRIVCPQLSPEELLAYVAHRLGAATGGAETSGTGAARVWQRLEGRLEQLTGGGKHPVLVFDEAHLLEMEHLQTLQLLLNLRESRGVEFSMILAGRPDLLPRVKRVGGLEARIAVRAALRSLSPADTAEYVRHRLRVAGREETVFSPETLRSLCELSQGVPRRINQLCDVALLVGFADELQALTPVEVEAAARELASVSA
jgi:general secretion pathway protein A